MISFKLTDRDQEILSEARRQEKLAAKYARDFENDEDQLLPAQYPEAEGLPSVHVMLDGFADDISGHKIINALIYLEDWYGGVPLREVRYSLGNTVLEIAGRPQQFARWHDKTIAIGLTEPLGGSNPASTKTTARYDPQANEWTVDGEKIFITYAQGCDAVLVLARMIHPDRPQQLSTFLVEKGTPGFTVGKQVRKRGIRWEDTAVLAFSDRRIPAFNHIDGDLKKTLQSFSGAPPWSRPTLWACRVPRWISPGRRCARSASSPTAARLSPGSQLQRSGSCAWKRNGKQPGSRWCGRNGSNSAKAPGKSIPRRLRRWEGNWLARWRWLASRSWGPVAFRRISCRKNGSATPVSSTSTRAPPRSSV